jgi:sn-glycerol 3-phosphate transport system substrate-binding protein
MPPTRSTTITRPRHPRRIAGLAVVGALALMAAACGNSSSTAKSDKAAPGDTIAAADLPVCPLDALDKATQPVEVVLWHAQTAKTKDTLEAQAAKYNASQTKVKVRVEAQGTYEELAKKYQSGVPTKDLPGIALMEDLNIQSLADSGTVLPAQSCINASGTDMSDFLPTATAAYTVKGAVYPASLNLSTPLIYINRNHFRQAGLDPERTPQTLDEIRQDAQKIKDAGVVAKPVALSLQPWFIESWLTGEHAPAVDNDNGRGSGQTTAAAFDDDQARQLFTWIRDMYKDGLLDPVPDTAGNINDYLAMAQKQASMIIESSTAATSVESFLKGNLDPSTLQGGANVGNVDPASLDIGAGQLPGVHDPGKVQVGGGAWYIMNTTPPAVQAAAWDFITWWNKLDQQVTWNLEGSYLPYRISAATDARVVDRWTNTLAGRWLAISYGQLTNGVDPNYPGPLIGPYDAFRDAVRSGLDGVTFKGTDPSAAVATAAQQTTDAIVRYNKDNF